MTKEKHKLETFKLGEIMWIILFVWCIVDIHIIVGIILTAMGFERMIFRTKDFFRWLTNG